MSSTRPQRVAKTQALEKYQASSDVEMQGIEEDFDTKGVAGDEAYSEVGGSDYGGKGDRGKRKRVGSGKGQSSPKRARKDALNHGAEEAEVVSYPTIIKHNPSSRLFRLGTGMFSRGPRSKSKKKVGSGSRGLGRLKKILDMPVEVFCEILVYLQPLDLLNLARSSKALHELLVTRRMRSAWQASLNEQKVPPLPDKVPINEVQLASMLFDNTCQSCGGLANHKIYHDELLVRLCKSCLDYNTTSCATIANAHGKAAAKDETLYELLPSNGRGKFLIPDFEDVIEPYLSLPSGSFGQRKLVSERRGITDSIYNFGRELSRWRCEKFYEKQSEADDASKERRKSILKKLRDLGYSGDEIVSCQDSLGFDISNRFSAILSQPRRLTDRIWNSISEELLRYMEMARKERNLRNKKEALLSLFETFCAAYAKDHEGDGPKFNYSELLELPSVKGAIEAEEELVLPTDLFANLEPDLRIICEERPEKLKEECLAMVKKGREDAGLLAFGSICDDDAGRSCGTKEIPTTDCPLLAASTFFDTRYMSIGYSFQDSLDRFFGEIYPISEDLEYWSTSPWEAPEFKKDFAAEAELILKQLDLPPNVTYEYMKSISRTVRCKACPNMRFASWEGCISHRASHRDTKTGAEMYFDN